MSDQQRLLRRQRLGRARAPLLSRLTGLCGSSCSASSSGRTRWPTPTTAPTTRRTRSTSCSRRRAVGDAGARSSPRSSRTTTRRPPTPWSRVAVDRPRRAHRGRRRRRAAHLPPLLAVTRRRRSTPTAYRGVGTALARIFLLQIFFYGLMALGSALLNARRRFFAPAWAPVLANLVIIAVLLVDAGELDGRDPIARRWPATTAACAARSASAPPLGIAVDGPRRSCPRSCRAGVRLRFRPGWRHPAVRKLLTLSGWTLGYVAANQVALIVVKNLAKPGSGGQDAYSRPSRSSSCPTACSRCRSPRRSCPTWPASWHRKDRAGVHRPHRRSASALVGAASPSRPRSACWCCARPIIGALLQHGEFTRARRRHHRPGAGRVRARPGRLLGLPVRAPRLLRPPGHPDAVRDQRRRERCSTSCSRSLLVGRFGVLGLGLAFALAYLLSAAWALQVLSYKVAGLRRCGPIFASLGRMLLAVARDGRGRVARRAGPSAATAAPAPSVAGGRRHRGRRRRLRRRAGAASRVTRARRAGRGG